MDAQELVKNPGDCNRLAYNDTVVWAFLYRAAVHADTYEYSVIMLVQDLADICLIHKDQMTIHFFGRVKEHRPFHVKVIGFIVFGEITGKKAVEPIVVYISVYEHKNCTSCDSVVILQRDVMIIHSPIKVIKIILEKNGETLRNCR